MSIVSVIVGIVILVAVAQALLPTAMTSLFGLIDSTTNNLSVAQKATLRTIVVSLNYIIYLLAAIGIVFALIQAFKVGGKGNF